MPARDCRTAGTAVWSSRSRPAPFDGERESIAGSPAKARGRSPRLIRPCEPCCAPRCTSWRTSRACHHTPVVDEAVDAARALGHPEAPASSTAYCDRVFGAGPPPHCLGRRWARRWKTKPASSQTTGRIPSGWCAAGSRDSRSTTWSGGAPLTIKCRTRLCAHGARRRPDVLVALREAGVDARPGLYVSDAIRLASGSLAALPAELRSELHVQDEASQLVAALVSVRPGDRVLDLCAAPGGKTIAIGARQPTLSPHRQRPPPSSSSSAERGAAPVWGNRRGSRADATARVAVRHLLRSRVDRRAVLRARHALARSGREVDQTRGRPASFGGHAARDAAVGRRSRSSLAVDWCTPRARATRRKRGRRVRFSGARWPVRAYPRPSAPGVIDDGSLCWMVRASCALGRSGISSMPSSRCLGPPVGA